jgi:hypothetical protein
MGKDIVYLSQMHITQRVITGYNIPDTHEKLLNLNPQEKEQVWKELCNELKYNTGMYMYRAMKKLREHACVLGTYMWLLAHHFSYLKI